MSDSDLSNGARRRVDPAVSAATAEQFAALSDDESDDGRVRAPIRLQRRRTPSREGSMSPGQRSGRRAENRSVSPKPTHTVTTGTDGGEEGGFDVVHFPPNIMVKNSVTTALHDTPAAQFPIMYRLKPGVRKGKATAAETLMELVEKHGGDPLKMADYLQSNANLIKWSDGSQTLSIGSTQFLMIEDTITSNFEVHHIADDKTCYYASKVNKVARVQPSSTGNPKRRMAGASSAIKEASRISQGRVMLRCMDDRVEQAEAVAKEESLRKERERIKLEAKRRQVRERNVRATRPLTVDHLESDYESDEDHVRKMEERFDAERLMRAKRAAPTHHREVPVKRRKAGGRRVVGGDDDDSDESE